VEPGASGRLSGYENPALLGAFVSLSNSLEGEPARLQNSHFSGLHLGTMRNQEPGTNGAASRADDLTDRSCTQPPLNGGSGILHQNFVDQETGEILICEHLGDGSLKPVVEASSIRLERFVLQSAIKHLLPKKRVDKCLSVRAYGKDTVDVMHNARLQSSHYAGLQTCGSVWDCPVCAAKISERRRVDEVLPAMDKWQDLGGGQCLLLTLTNPHNISDVLLDLVKGQQKAIHRFWNNRAMKALQKGIGFVGSIRAWEVTHGLNGFHPHFHIILFVETGLDLAQLEEQFYLAWSNACRLAKLAIPDRSHGVRLHDGSQAHAYASKGVWGLDHEITKGHLKKSNKGRSPMDLIRSYVFDRDKQAAALFIEYSKAYHAKRQLYWSPGLKDLFGIGEKTDEEVAGEQDETAVILGRIEWPVWKLVLKTELRGEILELGRLGSWEAIKTLLDDLVVRTKVEIYQKGEIGGPPAFPQDSKVNGGVSGKPVDGAG